MAGVVDLIQFRHASAARIKAGRSTNSAQSHRGTGAGWFDAIGKAIGKLAFICPLGSRQNGEDLAESAMRLS
jgi:hypothetical protein